MKKVILSAFVAVAALFATSCAKDATEAVIAPEGDASVSFAINAPVLGSRAFGDGLKAKRLNVLVYDKNGYRDDLSVAVEMDNPIDQLKKQVEIKKLIKGETYSFLFWASVDGTTVIAADAAGTNKKITAGGTEYTDKLFALNTTDGTITVCYNSTVGNSNNENFDAFFAQEMNLNVSGAITKTITLKRPFAQINVGTDDKAELLRVCGADALDNAKSMLSIDKYNKFSLKDGSVDTESKDKFTIGGNLLPKGSFTISTGATYDYLLMDYVLVPADKQTLNLVSITLTDITGSESSRRFFDIRNVPVQRNYRTNIVGSFFTTSQTFNVVIDPMFYDFDATITDGGNLTALENFAQNVTISGTINDHAWINSDDAKIEQVITLDNATIANSNDAATQTFHFGANINATFKGTGTIGQYSIAGAETCCIELSAMTTTVNIDGDNLVFEGGSGSKINNCIRVNSGTVNIYNGYFHVGLDQNGKESACILVNSTKKYSYGTVNIYGGTFYNETANAKHIGAINTEDNSYAKVVIYGGKFVDQDLTDSTNPDVANGNIKIAAGYHQVKSAQPDPNFGNKYVYEVVAD